MSNSDRRGRASPSILPRPALHDLSELERLLGKLTADPGIR
ncbi:hypothetical protein [Microbacterium sp. Leaf161]|nr:hypothetical protein [Microbacterium sp. Leaf161]